MSGALDGIVIADFSRVLAGPYATMLLADLGARVIKIERPELGDDTRSWGPPFAGDGMSTYFHSVNRNKQSVALDLKTEGGVEQARAIIEQADIVIENFPTGTMKKFGLDYESLSSNRPELIYCSITGFGSADAAADLPGYDLLVQAVGGLMSITGESDNHFKVGVALVDVITGLHAVMGIQAAILHRNATGEGQKIELSLLKSLLSAMVNQSSAWVSGGVVPAALGNSHPSIAPYELFSAADGDFVVAIGNDAQFRILCDALGLNDVSSDVRFVNNPARVAHRAELATILNTTFAQESVQHWVDRLRAAKLPVGPIHTIAKAFEFAESLGLEPIVEIDAARYVSHPVEYSKSTINYSHAAPQLAAENQDA